MTDDDRRFDTRDVPDGGPDPAAGLPPDVTPPADLRNQVVGRLRDEGLLAPGSTAPPAPTPLGSMRWVLAAAAVAAAFFAGRLTAPGGDRGAGVPTPPPGEEAAQWALFLYEDGPMAIGDRTVDEVEGEYVAWARDAAEAGTLVLGEKLAEVEFVLDSDAPPTERPLGAVAPPGVLTGLFIVEAPSLEAAVAAARSTPHRAFGGTVLIRPIDPT